MAKKEDVMGTGIGARPPAMQSRKQVMPGRMQKPMQPQYGAQQNMQPQYGGMQNMQPGGQPMRPASAVMPRDWQESQQPRPTSAVMPNAMQGLNQAMMQMLMRRK